MVVYPTTDKANATNPKPPAPQSPTDHQEQPGDNAAPAKEQLSLAALADIVVSVIAVQQFPLGVRECLLATKPSGWCCFNINPRRRSNNATSPSSRCPWPHRCRYQP